MENLQLQLKTLQTKFEQHTHDRLNSLQIIPRDLQGKYFTETVWVTTNGTTPVSVWGANTPSSTPFPMTIQQMYLINNDTTAGNITLASGSNTICAFAKGATQRAMIGAIPSDFTVANINVGRNQQLTVVSSSAGNATVAIVYQIPYPNQ